MTDINEIVAEQVKWWTDLINAYPENCDQDELEAQKLMLQPWLAIQDVLAITPKKGQSPYYKTQREWGYNQALSEIHQAITNRLGGME